jgi:hypothetical protein
MVQALIVESKLCPKAYCRNVISRFVNKSKNKSENSQTVEDRKEAPFSEEAMLSDENFLRVKWNPPFGRFRLFISALLPSRGLMGI